MIRVGDPDDDRLAGYRELRDAVLRRQVEERDSLFVTEGHLAVQRLVASTYPVVSLLIGEGRAEPLAGLAQAVGSRGAPVYIASQEVLDRTVGFRLHRGVVALGRRRPPTPFEELVALAGPGPLVAAEGLNDHENLGSLFRNAAALGAAGVLLDPRSADPLYRRSVRVSVGHVLTLPWSRSRYWPAELRRLAGAGWQVVALTPDLAAPSLHGFRPRGRVALLVGSEGHGLSAAARDAADVELRVPMRAGVDSLNVATAAGIALFHLSNPAAGGRRGAGPAPRAEL